MIKLVFDSSDDLRGLKSVELVVGSQCDTFDVLEAFAGFLTLTGHLSHDHELTFEERVKVKNNPTELARNLVEVLRGIPGLLQSYGVDGLVVTEIYDHINKEIHKLRADKK